MRPQDHTEPNGVLKGVSLGTSSLDFGEQVPFVSWKAISFFQQIQMKVKTVVVLEILAFKIWKNLNKKQNFSKLYRRESLN